MGRGGEETIKTKVRTLQFDAEKQRQLVDR